VDVVVVEAWNHRASSEIASFPTPTLAIENIRARKGCSLVPDVLHFSVADDEGLGARPRGVHRDYFGVAPKLDAHRAPSGLGRVIEIVEVGDRAPAR
jgi:hypothetical protein